MRLMEYLNDDGDFEVVETYGFAFSLGSKCKDYYEAYSKTKGWIFVPIDKVIPIDDNT